MMETFITSNLDETAIKADVIIMGYAFKKADQVIKVKKLNDKSAAVFDTKKVLIETNMDDIEISIVRDYLDSALKYMEDQ